jgi:hypothetical protein
MYVGFISHRNEKLSSPQKFVFLLEMNLKKEDEMRFSSQIFFQPEDEMRLLSQGDLSTRR